VKLRDYHQKVREIIATQLALEDGLTFSAVIPRVRDEYLASADRIIKDVAATAPPPEVVRASLLPGDGQVKP
jgi:hypothetical protein